MFSSLVINDISHFHDLECGALFSVPIATERPDKLNRQTKTRNVSSPSCRDQHRHQNSNESPLPRPPDLPPLCPPVGLNPADPGKEDEAALHIGTRFITDRFSLRFPHHMHNADQCRDERGNEMTARGADLAVRADLGKPFATRTSTSEDQ